MVELCVAHKVKDGNRFIIICLVTIKLPVLKSEIVQAHNGCTDYNPHQKKVPSRRMAEEGVHLLQLYVP